MFLMSEVPLYLIHKKRPPCRTLQQGYAWGLMAVLGGGAVSYTRVSPPPDSEGNVTSLEPR